MDVGSDDYHTFCDAKLVNVPESHVTKEFLEARADLWIKQKWKRYRHRCRMRHEWGIYLCSYFDWDWDIASCLQRLFKLPVEVEPQAAPIATVSLDAGNADTWNFSTEIKLPKQMRVAYKSTTGQTKFRTILFSTSSDDVTSTGHAVLPEAAIALESSCTGGEEGEDGAGIVTHEFKDAVPTLDTRLEMEVKQIVEKPDKGSVVIPKPRSGGIEESEEGLVGTMDQGNDAPQLPETELGARDNDDDDDSGNEDDSAKTIQNLEAIWVKQVDQISICSLD